MLSGAKPCALLPSIKNFAWGKHEEESRVFSLAHSNTPSLYPKSNLTIEQQQPYAELWLGTHPTGPSRVLPDVFIQSHSHNHLITPYPDPSIAAKTLPTLSQTLGDANLPYLFKVLSIKQALSIQSHPDKALARRLHEDHPEIYKDPNHKPELVVALTPMRALCGFRDVSDIIHNITQMDALLSPIFHKNQYYINYNPNTVYSSEENDTILRSIWAALHNTPQETATSIIFQFLEQYKVLRGVYVKQIARVDTSQITNFTFGVLALCYELATLYPNDIAVFSPLFLHYFALSPGISVFLGPNIPHAYLNGDCIEVMACSDNVIRAGLTPKFRDVKTLLSSLTYHTTTWPIIDTGYILSNDDNELQQTVYQPPVGEFDEFMVIETKFKQQNPHQPRERGVDVVYEKSMVSLPSRSILLGITGQADVIIEYSTQNGETRFQQQNHPLDATITYPFRPGTALYIPEHSKVTIRTKSLDFLSYRCSSNVDINVINDMNHFIEVGPRVNIHNQFLSAKI